MIGFRTNDGKVDLTLMPRAAMVEICRQLAAGMVAGYPRDSYRQRAIALHPQHGYTVRQCAASALRHLMERLDGHQWDQDALERGLRVDNLHAALCNLAMATENLARYGEEADDCLALDTEDPVPVQGGDGVRL